MSSVGADYILDKLDSCNSRKCRVAVISTLLRRKNYNNNYNNNCNNKHNNKNNCNKQLERPKDYPNFNHYDYDYHPRLNY